MTQRTTTFKLMSLASFITLSCGTISLPLPASTSVLTCMVSGGLLAHPPISGKGNSMLLNDSLEGDLTSALIGCTWAQ
jgi:hypothetical protein